MCQAPILGHHRHHSHSKLTATPKQPLCAGEKTEARGRPFLVSGSQHQGVGPGRGLADSPSATP